MAAYSSSGTTFAITAPASIPATYDSTGYAALTYTTVGEVESLPGEIGASFALVTFNPLDGSGIQKLKGTPDGGSTDFNVALDADDTGQDAVIAAAASMSVVSVKITLPSGDIVYNTGLVMKAPIVVGGADDVTMRAISVEFNNHLVFVEAA